MSFEKQHHHPTPVNQSSLLHSAVLENNEKAVRFLLKHGADANARVRASSDQIHRIGDYSTKDCNSITCELFNRYRSSSVSKSYTLQGSYRNCSLSTLGVAESAASRRSSSVVQQQKSLAIVHVAAANGNPAILELLLDFGAEVNSRMEGDYTALVIAVLCKNYAVAEHLVLRGADVDARSKNGRTPMYYAVKTKQIDMVRLLLRSGADPNARADNDVTPLHIAVERKLLDVAQLLLTNGGEVNARTKTGVTPLHCAAVKGQQEITEMLLKHGADVSVIVKKGKIDVTPLLWVTEGERKRISDIVYRYVAKNSAVGFYRKFIKKLWRGVVGKSVIKF